MAITLDGTTGITAPGVTDTGNLSVTGTSTLTGAVSAGALTQTGSSTATSFIPTGSTVPANGMYLSAANTLNLATNTTNQVSISSGGIVTGTAGNLMLVQGTSQTAPFATTTVCDFTGIPSWVKRITLMFQGVSTNGTTDICVQLGTGATPTYTTSGYTGTSSYAGGSGTAMATSGLITVSAVAAAQNYSGIAVISNINGNAWTFQGTMSPSATAQNGPRYGSGYVSLAAVLTAVRITAGGTDTFDAGTINIQYE